MIGFPGYDERWRYGMNGWRIQIADECEYEGISYNGGEEGEVTGYEPLTNCFWIVFDGDEYPRILLWNMVIPA